MTLAEHILKSIETEAPATTFVFTVGSDNAIVRGLHGAIGLVTECAELNFRETGQLDRINLREECGDLLWYFSILRDAFPFSLGALPEPMPHPLPKRPLLGKQIRIVTVLSGDFLDIFKKWTFYPREPAIDVFTEKFMDVEQSVYDLIHMLGGDVAFLRQTNIDKLQLVRYKKGAFTAEEANDRDLTAERELLEKDKH